MQKYNVTGMSCAACSARVEKAVKKLDSVTDCSVNLLTGTMIVEGNTTPEQIITAVTNAGYGASLSVNNKKSTNQSKNQNNEIKVIKNRLIYSLIFLIILMYFSMGHTMLGLPIPSFLNGNYVAIGILQLILSAIVMVINQRFFISGFRAIKNLAPNMDTLVALGSSAAFIYSVYALFAMTVQQQQGNSAAAMHYLHEFYFESAAMILTLITVGKLLEGISKGKTTNAIKALINLSPKTATVIKNDQEVTVDIDSLKKDDIFLVKPGESIPADGIVIEGESAVDESALTGESIPIDKGKGDKISAATLNQSGYLKCTATHVGEDTALSKIIKLVSEASASKAPIAKIADKVSGVFVPAVIIISIITLLSWLLVGKDIGYSLARAISVLVISCPCALGLATPVAIMVGNGVGAKNGILFKTATSLEITGKAKVVVLDKTGTVTEGKPTVTDIIPLNNTTMQELLTIALSLEQNSEHPLAFAITTKAKNENITAKTVTNFKALPGNGLMAMLDGETLRGGNFAFISTVTTIDNEHKTIAEKISEQGKTPLFFCLGSKLIGIIAVADVVKKDSVAAIKQLKSIGVKVIMLTGDNTRTANAIGKLVGVDRVIADVLPEDKENAVKQLKQYGRVIMVGDGINDAPALTTADVGMAIGAGTDIAIDAADIVLMNSSLSDVVAAIKLSRATLKNIHENLFWAFIYNVIGIPLATGVFIALLGLQLNPMFGAAAMSLSSFCVVTNALRLNLVKIKPNDIKNNNKEEIKMQKTMIIEGMMCEHCQARVKKLLEGIEGVQIAEVDHTKGTAVLTISNDVEASTLKSVIENDGYKVINIE